MDVYEEGGIILSLKARWAKGTTSSGLYFSLMLTTTSTSMPHTWHMLPKSCISAEDMVMEGDLLGRKTKWFCWSNFTWAQHQGISSPYMEKRLQRGWIPRTISRMWLLTREFKLTTLLWPLQHCFIWYIKSYLETPWPASLVLSVRRVSSKRFLNHPCWPAPQKTTTCTQTAFQRKPRDQRDHFGELSTPENVSWSSGRGLAMTSCSVSWTSACEQRWSCSKHGTLRLTSEAPQQLPTQQRGFNFRALCCWSRIRAQKILK